MKRVRVGKLYTYDPVWWDVFDNKVTLQEGEIVKVVNLPGCPKANTMGRCYVQARAETGEWKFAGLIMCASLEPFMG